ncbi:MAG: hypothetical protein LBS36_13370 [Oscillospiraceae bacterium]|jgi:pimeloyl-ACP methyl ester carboxylesterase|nr:hypothetical protein [Oscillospiraceae bacterium]
MKRFLGILLTAALLFSAIVPAFAAPAAEPFSELENDGLPIILVRGMDGDALTVDPGDGTSRLALEIDTEELTSALFKAFKAGLFGMSADKAVDELIAYANDVCKYIACDKTGRPVYDTTIQTYPLALSEYPAMLDGSEGFSESNIARSAAEVYGAERTYYFAYDWRENPLDVSDDLAEMVDRALLESGKDKVNIVCASLGGTETVAYLTEYGYEKVNSCVFVSSAFSGIYLASDMLSGRITVDGDVLANYVLYSMQDNAVGSFFVKALKSVGVFNLLARFTNSFIDKNLDKVAEGFLRDNLGYIPSFWALVLPEDYEEAVSTVFGDDLEGNAEFIAITEELHQMVLGRDELLRAAAADGVHIAVIAGYNKPSAPGYARSTEQGDGTLDTALMSGGATVAPYGKTLGDDYVAADASKLSPDRVIDASACLFPDATWFVKDSPHVGCRYGSEYADFLFWLVSAEGQPTVNDSPLYPQFMRTDSEQNLFPLQ